METTWNLSAREAALHRQDEKRRLVMAEAARFFSRRGYHGTSMSAVAAALGVSKATLYNYFPDKAALLFGCARAAHDGAVAIAEANACRDGPALDRLERVLSDYAAHVLGNCFHFVMFLEPTSLRPEDAAVIQDLRDRFDRIVRTLLLQSREEGDAAFEHDNFAAFTVIGAVNWMARWYDPAGPMPPADVVKEVVDMALRGVSTRRP